SLVLTSARWFTHAVAERIEARCSEAYAALAEKTAARSIELLQFLGAIEPFLGVDRGDSPEVQTIVHDLQRRWLEILELDENVRSIERSSPAIADRVAVAFRAPSPGWPMARYHAPDIMIASASAEAARRGEFTMILGELHTGCNLNLAPIAVASFPDVE